ncbi:MAG: L-fuculokinase [Carboxylicivirga sp.]|nr:L-fuculokinase [Carboxylicivirga sp.]
MKQKDIAIVFDCGATNVRVIAIDATGSILASHSMPNETDEDPHYPGGRIWDLDKLWGKLCDAAKVVTAKIDGSRIAGVTVTTFGVDGAFVDEQGKMLYPIISWQCQRTAPIMDNIDKYLPLQEVYKLSGVYPYAFNTINKMIWFKENKPEVMEKAHRFLFIPSLLINKLSGAMVNDATMVGTAMMADLDKRDFSSKILNTIGVKRQLFGQIEEPGHQAGNINEQASELTGLPVGTSVFLAGHDTQFAIFGSGAKLNQPVLSSGTWEILMTRSEAFKSSVNELDKNLTTELDAQRGVYNIGQNWLGSGVLEWFSKNYYSELEGDKLYETMIGEAEQEQPGAGGVMVDPAFYDDGTSANGGTITGLTINTKRSQLYRAFLESLAFRLREALDALEVAGSFKAERIICVGGGSKNRLWNQLRADVCNTPIQFIEQKETTVLGASMFVFAGAGVYKSVEAARNSIDYQPRIVQPSGNSLIYDALYKKYIDFKK